MVYDKIISRNNKEVLVVSNSVLQKAMENAEASINMEGLYISDFCKELCEKLMKKEITFQEYLNYITTGAETHGV